MALFERLSLSGSPVAVMNNALTPSITSLASGANIVSAVIPSPSTAGEADWELLFTPAAGLSAGVTVSLWLLPALDNSNYADGGATDPAAAHLVAVFTCASGAGQQRLVVRGIPWPAENSKAVISNDTGQAFSAATTHTLTYQNVQRSLVNG